MLCCRQCGRQRWTVHFPCSCTYRAKKFYPRRWKCARSWWRTIFVGQVDRLTFWNIILRFCFTNRWRRVWRKRNGHRQCRSRWKTEAETTTNEAVIGTSISKSGAPKLAYPSSLVATPFSDSNHEMRMYNNLILLLSEIFAAGLDYVWSLWSVCTWYVMHSSIVWLCTPYAQLIHHPVLPSIEDE